MAQIMIDIEDNENCGYFPIQVFETHGEPRSASTITVAEMPGTNESYDIVGWCSDGNGTACRATATVVADSGSGQAMMITGGDFGIRLKPSSSPSPWNLESGDQKGEPYLVFETSIELFFRNEP